MAKINEYYQKRELRDQLNAELEQLESDETLKSELEFEKDIQGLMAQFNKSPTDVLQVLAAIDPSVATAGKSSAGQAKGTRPLKTYKNPHTGEVVKTRGGNHKTLNEWRKEHGKDVVQSWAS
ncbi:histone-like nucleoid-structuring protein, MvaT/MvaU family [Pseudoalteromonas sp. GABNS16H]|uniref:histone-like nucleoid-structuring protein, MvaT/MvaU family n=1 Tax=Pseudoalteromonas sp. GABNS16H TaxID=3025325 RepID=UPI0023613C42|nr:histone-like nucleoid-structuring protein, MvaT/MvaU family [Pseudoalteromonas sp. GABNS16H]MDC9611651.1 DNA binding protein [Pseudoalteromonas sp. GABNS16H]